MTLNDRNVTLAEINDDDDDKIVLGNINVSFECVEYCLFILGSRHTSLRAASHRAVGYVQNRHPINGMNPICLNSFRIKSAQNSGRRREQN